MTAADYIAWPGAAKSHDFNESPAGGIDREVWAIARRALAKKGAPPAPPRYADELRVSEMTEDEREHWRCVLMMCADIEELDDCWTWYAKTDRDGYGLVRFEGRERGAHRVAYQLFVGPIGHGLCVLHHCDNPGCIRPDHLFLGTRVENIADMISKGRAAWQRKAVSP